MANTLEELPIYSKAREFTVAVDAILALASAAEVVGHLRRAVDKGYMESEALQSHSDMADELGRMLGGFIKYLHRCAFKNRGRFKR